MDEIESCEVCGFVWAEVVPDDVAGRVRAAATSHAEVLRTGAATLAVRPPAGGWSAVEYGCHVRDVLVNLRDRIVLGAVEDNPVPNAMHGTPRVELGLYEGDDPVVVAADLKGVADLFARTWERLPDVLRDRPIFYGWPVPATRDLSWVAAQAVHECEHHLADARSAAAGTRATLRRTRG